MADQNIVNYIKQQLQAGYDINTIRAYLVNYGYDQAIVDEAVRAAYAKPAEFPFVPVIAGVILVLIVIGGIYFITREKTPAQLLDIQTSTLVDEIEAGSSLTFTIDMMNLGAAKRYDLSITHEIIDSQNNIIKTQEESAAIETRASKTSQIIIPSDTETGTYKLKTTVIYDSSQATASFSFRVKEKTTAPSVTQKQCPLSCDDNNPCTQDTCSASTNFECQHIQITPCCGNNICESGETNDDCPNDCKAAPPVTELPQIITLADVKAKARELAKTSPTQADNYCKNLEKETHKDTCYSEVASATQTSAYCDKIISDTKRDQCYTDFALKGDYLVCDKITNKYLKQSCVSLRSLPPQ